MMTLKNYTLRELYAMNDLMDRIDELLDDYVTNDFKRVTGLYELNDRISIEIDGRLEDMENEKK